MLNIYQKVDLSLTENLIPNIVHIKQFDKNSRKIVASLYHNAVELEVPTNCMLSVTGTRPDGKMFQYTSETSPTLVYLENNKIVFTITQFMSEYYGRMPLDIYIVDSSGNAVSTFSITILIERSAVNTGEVAIYDKSHLEQNIVILGCFITENGRFGIVTDDNFKFGEGTQSSTALQTEKDMVQVGIENDMLTFTTNTEIQLTFTTNSDGEIVVGY